VNSDYVTLRQTSAERTTWRYSRGISRTCSTAEDWKKEGRKEGPSWHNPPNLSWLGTGTKYAGLHTRGYY